MTDAVAENSGLPELTEAGVLPLGIHIATLQEVQRVFVEEAPHSQERSFVFAALTLYAVQIWTRFPGAVLWVDGGFVTHKPWASPKDVDVAVLVAEETYDLASNEEDMSLWTLQGVSAWAPTLVIDAPRVQPMGGLVDGFYVPADNPDAVAYWHGLWQCLANEDGTHEPAAKGFVEVRQP